MRHLSLAAGVKTAGLSSSKPRPELARGGAGASSVKRWWWVTGVSTITRDGVTLASVWTLLMTCFLNYTRPSGGPLSGFFLLFAMWSLDWRYFSIQSKKDQQNVRWHMCHEELFRWRPAGVPELVIERRGGRPIMIRQHQSRPISSLHTTLLAHTLSENTWINRWIEK